MQTLKQLIRICFSETIILFSYGIVHTSGSMSQMAMKELSFGIEQISFIKHFHPWCLKCFLSRRDEEESISISLVILHGCKDSFQINRINQLQQCFAFLR